MESLEETIQKYGTILPRMIYINREFVKDYLVKDLINYCAKRGVEVKLTSENGTVMRASKNGLSGSNGAK